MSVVSFVMKQKVLVCRVVTYCDLVAASSLSPQARARSDDRNALLARLGESEAIVWETDTAL